MKKNIALLLFCIGVLPFTSCKKMLDTEPVSNTSQEQFYQTPSDAELALTGCYNVLNEQTIQATSFSSRGGLFFMQLQVMLEGTTDEAVTRVNFSDNDNSPWGYAAWNSTSTYNQQAWFFFYAGIQRCNLLLDKINGIGGIADARKKEIVAEARFLRGFYYMYMGMMWGGVPVNTTSNPDLYAPRAPLKDVFTQSFDDLNFAYQNLPHRAAIGGRANKWAAAGALARAYAFVASAKTYNATADVPSTLNTFDWVDATDAYTKVKTLSDDIIANSGYVLATNYGSLFRELSKATVDQESLFVVSGSESPTATNMINMQNLFIPQGNNASLGGGIGRLVPVGELYAKYNSLDPRRTVNLTGSLNATTRETVDGAVYFAANTITATSIKNNGTYYGGKFRMIDPANKRIQLNYWSGNYPVIRLAEIYLLRAEAVYALTGNATTARADLSTVRQRAVGANNIVSINAAYLKPDFIQELLDERSRELCFEGLRHFDLMRFNRYTSTINALTSDRSLAFNNQSVVTVKQNWSPYRIWFPIPYAERILNTNLVQNPGYN